MTRRAHHATHLAQAERPARPFRRVISGAGRRTGGRMSRATARDPPVSSSTVEESREQLARSSRYGARAARVVPPFSGPPVTVLAVDDHPSECSTPSGESSHGCRVVATRRDSLRASLTVSQQSHDLTRYRLRVEFGRAARRDHHLGGRRGHARRTRCAGRRTLAGALGRVAAEPVMSSISATAPRALGGVNAGDPQWDAHFLGPRNRIGSRRRSWNMNATFVLRRVAPSARPSRLTSSPARHRARGRLSVRLTC